MMMCSSSNSSLTCMMMMLLAISQLILKGGLLRLRGMVEDYDRGEGLVREGNGVSHRYSIFGVLVPRYDT